MTGHAYFGDVEDVPPTSVRSEDGWQAVDIRFLLPPSMQLSSPVALFRALFPPGAAHRTHTHPDADEFVYVIRGKARIGAGDEERDAGPGTVQLIPAGTVHWLHNLDEDEPVEVVGGYLGVQSLQEAGYRYVGDGPQNPV
ncbi:MAG: cupin domain-containing protein [Streptosporangiales bacterium]|nr:cupin domain-containing protein [Streptosporangiales bacterium]MBO0892485.1 cupin domain-containing protein [Acidothermales bacterium]